MNADPTFCLSLWEYHVDLTTSDRKLAELPESVQLHLGYCATCQATRWTLKLIAASLPVALSDNSWKLDPAEALQLLRDRIRTLRPVPRERIASCAILKFTPPKWYFE